MNPKFVKNQLILYPVAELPLPKKLCFVNKISKSKIFSTEFSDDVSLKIEPTVRE
jgi:hypothetical protein